MTRAHRSVVTHLLVLLALFAPMPLVKAECAAHGDGCLVCVPKREVVKEKRNCWCIKRNDVSVPPILCPWEPGGSPINTFDWLERLLGCGKCCQGRDGCCPTACRGVRCGEVRQVRDLSEKTYEVNDCQWKWEVRRLPPCRCQCCGCAEMDASGAFGCGGEVGAPN